MFASAAYVLQPSQLQLPAQARIAVWQNVVKSHLWSAAFEDQWLERGQGEMVLLDLWLSNSRQCCNPQNLEVELINSSVKLLF